MPLQTEALAYGVLADTNSIPMRTSSPPCLSHFVFIILYSSAVPLSCALIDTHTHLMLSILIQSVLFAISPVIHSTPMHHRTAPTQRKSFVLKCNLCRCGLTLNATFPLCIAMDFVRFWFTCSPIVLFFWHSYYTDFGLCLFSLLGLLCIFDLSCALSRLPFPFIFLPLIVFPPHT